MAENLDAGFAKSSGKEDKYTGSALKNFFLNKLYADSFSGKKRGGGGGDASGGIAGYVARTPEEYDQVTKIHNTNVMDPQHRRIQEHLDNETERGEIRDSGRSQRDAQRTQLHVESTARLLREGTQNGGLSSVNFNHNTGSHNITFQPGYGAGAQGTSQQQDTVTPEAKANTESRTTRGTDRAARVAPAAGSNKPTPARIDKQTAAAVSYIDPGASTPKQDRQNSAAFSYAKPFKP